MCVQPDESLLRHARRSSTSGTSPDERLSQNAHGNAESSEKIDHSRQRSAGACTHSSREMLHASKEIGSALRRTSWGRGEGGGRSPHRFIWRSDSDKPGRCGGSTGASPPHLLHRPQRWRLQLLKSFQSRRQPTGARSLSRWRSWKLSYLRQPVADYLRQMSCKTSSRNDSAVYDATFRTEADCAWHDQPFYRSQLRVSAGG